MAFWTGETCEYCGGAISERRVSLHRRVGRSHALIEHVPAGVCTECGVRYFSANVLKTLREIVRARRKARREVRVPVYSMR